METRETEGLRRETGRLVETRETGGGDWWRLERLGRLVETRETTAVSGAAQIMGDMGQDGWQRPRVSFSVSHSTNRSREVQLHHRCPGLEGPVDP